MTSYLSNIDTIEKAYCVGFLSYMKDVNSNYADNCYELINIYKEDDEYILSVLENIVDIISDDGITSMTLKNKDLLEDINKAIKEFNNFTNEYKRAFIRGLYEYNNLLNVEDTNDIYIYKNQMIIDTYQDYMDYMHIPYFIDKEGTRIVIKHGTTSFDYLGYLYSDVSEMTFNYCNFTNKFSKCNFIKSNEKGVVPTKTNWSDVGYDLTIVEKIEDYNSKTSLYETFIKIQLDFGYYAEIVPRSSLAKSGYILANNIGIIDNGYRGTLKIALTKVVDDANELKLPFKCCQLIIKKQEYLFLSEVKSVNKTKRNEGGFGSTN